MSKGMGSLSLTRSILTSRAASIIVGALPLLLTNGCLYVHESHTIESGTRLHREKLDKLDQGACKFNVLRALGPPTRIAQDRSGAETWTYEFSKQKEATSKFFLLFKCEEDTNTSQQVQIKFDAQGKLAGVTQTK